MLVLLLIITFTFMEYINISIQGNDDGLCDDALQLNVEANLWGKKRFLGEIIARDFFGYAQSQN